MRLAPSLWPVCGRTSMPRGARLVVVGRKGGLAGVGHGGEGCQGALLDKFLPLGQQLLQAGDQALQVRRQRVLHPQGSASSSACTSVRRTVLAAPAALEVRPWQQMSTLKPGSRHQARSTSSQSSAKLTSAAAAWLCTRGSLKSSIVRCSAGRMRACSAVCSLGPRSVHIWPSAWQAAHRTLACGSDRPCTAGAQGFSTRGLKLNDQSACTSGPAPGRPPTTPWRAGLTGPAQQARRGSALRD